MLNNSPFYYQMFRKYILAIHHILSDIIVQRFDKNGNITKEIKVPVTLGGKTMMFQILENEVDIVGPILPRISFILSGLNIDEERKENPINKYYVDLPDGTNEEFIYSGKPYNIHFSVTVWTKYVEDLFQIIEQICVFFNPDFSVTVNEIEELNLKRDVTIMLNDDIDINISSDFEEGSEREVSADLTFILKGYLYPPIKNDNVIEFITQNFYNKDDNDSNE